MKKVYKIWKYQIDQAGSLRPHLTDEPLDQQSKIVQKLMCNTPLLEKCSLKCTSFKTDQQKNQKHSCRPAGVPKIEGYPACNPGACETLE